jgi:2-polyprenyl-6-methoxyphenol hydroxylase-like FAD-dependent oxidoreductase
MKVLISGAGIVGPATAIALRKAGIAAVLYEACAVLEPHRIEAHRARTGHPNQRGKT